MSRSVGHKEPRVAVKQLSAHVPLTKQAYQQEAQRLAREALAEDIGSGDVTSVLFGPGAQGTAYFLAKQSGIVSGMEVVRAVFAHLDPVARVLVKVKDGQPFEKGEILAEVRAPVRVLLSGERVALNFLQRLSGVATVTRRFVDAVGADSGIKIVDTRKTTPLLRTLEKAAVVHGGGCNHRMRLDDMAMIKNNHIDRAGGVAEAVEALRKSGFFKRAPQLPLCIEARTVAEALAAVEAGADIVLLDNMSPAQAGRCAEKVGDHARSLGIERPLIEVSGGMTLAKVGRYRRLPIDRISVGSLTHSAPALDIALRMKIR